MAEILDGGRDSGTKLGGARIHLVLGMSVVRVKIRVRGDSSDAGHCDHLEHSEYRESAVVFSGWLPRVSGPLKTTEGVIREKEVRGTVPMTACLFVSCPFHAEHIYGERDQIHKTTHG